MYDLYIKKLKRLYTSRTHRERIQVQENLQQVHKEKIDVTHTKKEKCQWRSNH